MILKIPYLSGQKRRTVPKLRPQRLCERPAPLTNPSPSQTTSYNSKPWVPRDSSASASFNQTASSSSSPPPPPPRSATLHPAAVAAAAAPLFRELAESNPESAAANLDESAVASFSDTPPRGVRRGTAVLVPSSLSYGWCVARLFPPPRLLAVVALRVVSAAAELRRLLWLLQLVSSRSARCAALRPRFSSTSRTWDGAGMEVMLLRKPTSGHLILSRLLRVKSAAVVNGIGCGHRGKRGTASSTEMMHQH